MNIVLFSTNGGHDYEFFAPIASHAWRFFGWEPVIAVRGISALVKDKLEEMRVRTVPIPSTACGEVTAVQTSRIYLPCTFPEDYVMTSDVDILPLSDYWPKDGVPRITGWDITGYPNPRAHVPICYVAMTGACWKTVMQPGADSWVESMDAGLGEIVPGWEADQDLLTKRVRQHGEQHFDLRWRYNERFGIGRVCRSGWEQGVQALALCPQVDCHALRPGYIPYHWNLIRAVLQTTGLHADWMESYVEDYQKSRL